jgi:hypothetical protein
LLKISSEVPIGITSTELEVVAKYCAEGKESARTVADNEGTSAKMRGTVAKKNRTKAKARRATTTRGVRWRRRLVGGGRHELDP